MSHTTGRGSTHRALGFCLLAVAVLGTTACDPAALQKQLNQNNSGVITLSLGDAQSVATGNPGVALEVHIVDLLNNERSKRGLPQLTSDPSLAQIAREHATTMANSQDLHHQNLRPLLSSWRLVGENVGQGPSAGSLHAAWLASPGHLANMVRRDFRSVGVGVHIDSRGRVWATQLFAGTAI